MKQERVMIVRAAGCPGWVAAVQYSGGSKELLDLDIQNQDPILCLKEAKDQYQDLEIKIDADPFWTKGIPEELLSQNPTTPLQIQVLPKTSK